MYLPAFLQIRHTFSTTINHVQLSITTWLLGLAISQLILGPFCDRFGRRPVLICGGVVFLLATLGCALSPAIWFLILSRLFQGFGVGSMMVAGYASIHSLYDDKRATLILAWTSSAAVIAPMIGPLLGSSILLFGNWRTIFYLILLFSSATFICTSLLLPESLQKENRISLHPVQIGKSFGKILMTWGFVARALAFGFLYSGIILWITTSPHLVMVIYRFSPSQFGYLQIPVFVGFILGAQCVRIFLRFLDREKVVWVGLFLSILGAVVVLFSSLFFLQSLFGLLGGMVIYTCGFGLAAAPLSRETLIAINQGMGMGTALFFVLMGGMGTLVSLVISLLNESPFTVALLLIGLSLFSILFFISKPRGYEK